MTDSFQELLKSHARLTEAKLDTLLTAGPVQGEVLRPERLLAAMRHSVLNGGKRIRPFLMIESAGLFSVEPAAAAHAAAALECIHCYSLVHDDLPAMDDDDLRRGQPTTHKQFDEATAILAGDALLTLAFDLLADPACHPDPETRTKLVSLHARCAGLGGMAGGQMLDLEGEHSPLAGDDIANMQAMKTGALIRCACEAGALLGNAGPTQRYALSRFGDTIGAAFQLADDLLDVTASSSTLGKQTGKDEARGKPTLVALLGAEQARERADQLLDEAIGHLSGFGARAENLAAAARFIVNRDH